MTATLERPLTDPVPTGVLPPFDSPVPSSSSGRVAAVLAVVLAIVASFATFVGDNSSSTLGGAARTVDNRIEMFESGAWVPVAADVPIGDDVLLRTIDGARLIVADGELSLAADTSVRVRFGLIDLVAGSLLVIVERPVIVAAGGSRVEGVGTWRIDLGVSPRVAVYRGSAGLDGQTATVAIGRLAQASFTSALGDVRPFVIDPADRWDARFAGSVIAIDRFAAATQASINRDQGIETRDAAFFADYGIFDGHLDEALEAFSVRRSGGRFGPPSEVLLGAIVAETLVEGARLAPTVAINEVDRLRAAGASWGIILARRDLTVDALRTTTDRALRKRAVNVVERAPDRAPTSPTTPQPSSSPSPAPSGSPNPSPTPSPTPTPSPSETDPPEQPGPGDTVDGIVDGVLDPVGDGLDAVVPGSGGAVDEVQGVTDGVTDLLDDLLGGGAAGR